MYKKILVLSVLFLLGSCKKKDSINCEEKFNNLYEKRYSLWFAMDSNNVTSNNNFNEQQYKALKKQLNDSLEITIDCTLKQQAINANEVLYLYKMKQLFLADKLKQVNSFFKIIDKEKVSEDIYFQLSLYELLCKELVTNQKPIAAYKTLLNSYSIHLKSEYKERAIQEFLDYLINDNIFEFKRKMLEKYPTSSSLSMRYDRNDRESIMKEIMVRADNLVFD